MIYLDQLDDPMDRIRFLDPIHRREFIAVSPSAVAPASAMASVMSPPGLRSDTEERYAALKSRLKEHEIG